VTRLGVGFSRNRAEIPGQKAKIALEQGIKTHRGSTGIAVSLTSELDGGGWSAPRFGRFTLRKDPVPIV
jgi:hypothetical protein